jgi:hypothetical protein
VDYGTVIAIMNRMHRSILLLLTAVAFVSACDETAVQDISAPVPANSARVLFFNFGVGSPAVNFYANDTKMTGILTATGQEATTGVNFGGVAAGGLYTAIPAGQYTISGRIAAAVDKDLPISGTPANLQADRAYSFYQSGIYNTATKQVDSFIVEDPFIANFDYSVAYVRFVHAISNANPMALFITNTTAGGELPVGEVVAYKSAGAYTAVQPGLYNLAARYPGQTTNAVARTGVTFSPGRVYTITARGNILVASTVLLGNTLNR